VFDSAAFDTEAFSVLSWDFGDIVGQAPLAGWGQGSSKEYEEDDLYCLTQAILIAMSGNYE